MNGTAIADGTLPQSPAPAETSDTARRRALATRLAAGGAAHLSVLSEWSSFAARGCRRVERLVRLRRHAMDAEVRGLTVAADFYWTEAHDEIPRLSRRPTAWREYVRTITNESEAPADADMLFELLVREAFANTHLACFYAWESTAPPRAFVHLDYVRRLRPVAKWSIEEDRRYTGPLTVREVRYRQGAGEYPFALALASDLARRFPGVTGYENLLVGARRDATLSALARSDTPRGRRADARTLATGLLELNRLRLEWPHNFAAFDALACLYLARAECLAADGRIAEALVDVEAALIHSPDIVGGADLRGRLDAEMQRLRVQAAADDRDGPRTQDAARANQQAAKGFRLVDAFRRSDEASAVADDLIAARGRLVWELIGLTPLEPADHRPLTLDDAIQTLVSDPPSRPEAVAERWAHVSRDNPHLCALDADRVGTYLRHRLFGEPFIPAPTDVDPVDVAPATLVVEAPRPSRAPVMFWACSRRNPIVKLQLVVAVGLAVVVSTFGAREFQGRRVRAEAYASLRHANDEQRLDLVLDAAERFLSRRLLSVDDRVPEVEAIYSEALVRWFNETAPPGGEADRRISRYRQLLSVTTTQGEH